MAEHPTCKWTGESVQEYTYYIWNLPVSFDKDQDGNYIYSKKNANGNWVPIYIGQGDLKDRAENHHQATCFSRKGATHIHVHLNSKNADRLA